MLQKIFLACISSFLALSSIESNEKYISTDGAELFCKEIGSGKPLIVLHGGAGYLTHDYLLPHLEPLKDISTVLFYDQRGLGKSSGNITPEEINLTTYIADIDAIRKDLGVKKVSLLGHSWGGFLAMHYALAHPESVDQLILVGSMPLSAQDLGLFFVEIMKRYAPIQEEINKIESSDLYLAGDPGAVESFLKMGFSTYLYNPEHIDRINLKLAQKSAQDGHKVWAIFKEQIFMKPYDLTDSLNALTCPTLIIHGNEDIIPFVTAEHIEKAIPSSKLVKIEKCGHFPFVEQPKLFIQSVKDFLK